MSFAAAVASAYFNCFTRMSLAADSCLSIPAMIETTRRTLVDVSVMISVLLAALAVRSASVLTIGARSVFSFTASTLRTGITCVMS